MKLLFTIFLLGSFQCYSQSFLKSILYDFEGLDINTVQVPDGAYQYGDVTYQVVANPLGYSDMLGNRSLRVSVNWNLNYGAFGKGNARYVELNPSADYLNFYFYNPLGNSNNATIEVILKDDDNDDHIYDVNIDDRWLKTVSINRSNTWQLISIPLNQFQDDNTGGNGDFDAGFTGNGGRVLAVEWRIVKPMGETSAVYYLDFPCYSEGVLPTGNTILDLPTKEINDYCLLGAYSSSPQNAPAELEGLFPADPTKKIKYVNTFMAFSDNGTSQANQLPGNNLQTLIDQGYTPIITWEPMYTHLPPTSSSQPHLQDILNGTFDGYIDSVADKIMTYTDTILIRPMHEFDGNWYPWCISQNGGNPSLFVDAYRYMVDRVRARGVDNIQWVWCPNSAPAPHEKYNWSVNAYPGDNYVDYVATNVYNHPFAGTPEWKTFRYVAADTYYYLRKYFPSKTFLFTEFASRERYASENPTSQQKAEWIEQMDKDVQSFFHEARGLISMNVLKEHDWRINSSNDSRNSFYQHIWLDDYYFNSLISVNDELKKDEIFFYPNPASNNLFVKSRYDNGLIQIYSVDGKLVYSKLKQSTQEVINVSSLAAGIYVLRLSEKENSLVSKFIKTNN